jgi:hypothetical protein
MDRSGVRGRVGTTGSLGDLRNEIKNLQASIDNLFQRVQELEDDTDADDMLQRMVSIEEFIKHLAKLQGMSGAEVNQSLQKDELAERLYPILAKYGSTGGDIIIPRNEFLEITKIVLRRVGIEW